MDPEKQIKRVSKLWLALLAWLACAPMQNAFHISSVTNERRALRSSYFYKSLELKSQQINNEEDFKINDDIQDNGEPIKCKLSNINRRNAIRVSSSSLAACVSLLATGEKSNALEPFKPAKRATAYLVDSTLPPSLIPFKATREAAVLKQIGSGLGTPKKGYTEDGLNLNNILNKTMFGTIEFVQGLGVAVETKGETFVFLGGNLTDVEDADLAVSLTTDIIKPRRDLDTAIGLSFVPISAQTALDQFITTGDFEKLTFELTNVQVPFEVIDAQKSLLFFARSKRLALLALCPEYNDIITTRKEGLQNVDTTRRASYVSDTQGFISVTQDPKFKLYTQKSMMKDFIPLNEKDNEGAFFAERILYDEAVATSIARWAMTRKDSMVVTISATKDVRFFGGANGRLPRVYKFFSPDSLVDDESVTTILLNPSAQETLSLSRFLRLEIGTTPDNWQYLTKVSDYFWFSKVPKVNMLPRMMNEI